MSHIHLDELDLSIGFENKNGVLYGEVYYLDYYGQNIFFAVSKSGTYQVCVYELAKKRIKKQGKEVEIICRGRKQSKKPLVFGTETWVETEEKSLLIPINIHTPVYRHVTSYVEFPATGTFKAICLEEEMRNGILNYYWECNAPRYNDKNNGKQQKNKKSKNSA